MRHYYLIVDTETTKKQTVADFGAVIVTKQGEIVEQVGHLVNGHFGKFPLFLIHWLTLTHFGQSRAHIVGSRIMTKWSKMVIAQLPRLA